jgi:N6-L-threonylcarbamoyladenine synthase
VRAITLVVDEALRVAGIDKHEIGLVAATRGPGLAGALLVGLNFARGFCLGLGVPLAGINHLEGHLHSVWLTRDSPPPPPPAFPLLALIVSGGHTQLVLMRDHGRYETVGATLDDAAGEAFDKVARLLGLTYPGGPAVQKAASSAGNPAPLPRARLPGTYDFSFSGLKTAVLHLAYQTSSGRDANEVRGKALPKVDVATGLSEEQIGNIAAGFQESVVDILVTKTHAAAANLGAASVAVVGGVAANRALRERMCAAIDLPVYLSAPEYSTDNAAMIASAGYFLPDTAERDVDPSLELEEVAGV